MSVRGENEGRQGVGTEREARVGRVVVVMKELWMSAIFSSKNSAKSSAVMED